jgi:hypothetical protein
VLRAASETRLRCTDHPHRRATRQCARCKQGYCDECAARFGNGTICDRCQEELDEKHRIEHPPVQERVRRFGLSLRNTLILVAILGVLAIPGSQLVKYMVETPISPEEFARFRYAAGGTFETAEGTNITSTVLGATVLSASSRQPGHEEKRLIDEYVGPGYGGYRTAEGGLPAEIVIQTSSPTKIEKLIFQQQPGEPPEAWAREVEVLAATDSPDGPYLPVGRFTLEQSEEVQRFVLPGAVNATWIRLRIISNYGGPYASLGEFNALILPRGPLGQGAPQVTPPPKP